MNHRIGEDLKQYLNRRGITYDQAILDKFDKVEQVETSDLDPVLSFQEEYLHSVKKLNPDGTISVNEVRVLENYAPTEIQLSADADGT